MWKQGLLAADWTERGRRTTRRPGNSPTLHPSRRDHPKNQASEVFFPQFTPAPLVRIREPFDDPGYIYELKMDGFRALAEISDGQVRLMSRRGNTYKSFSGLCASIGAELHREAILDGEIVCLDAEGRPQFYELLRRRGRQSPAVFYAFDLLGMDGQDLRGRPLIERKRLLREIMPEQSSALLYASDVDGLGCEFYRFTCEQDLEGASVRRILRVKS
jgi:bifunctional non-homologous end joining protein LigD